MHGLLAGFGARCHICCGGMSLMFVGNKHGAILMSDSPAAFGKNNHSHKHLFQIFTRVMQ